METSETHIHTEPPYDVRGTIISHGWYDLRPFSWDAKAGILRRVLRLQDGTVVLAEISDASVPEDPTAQVLLHHPEWLPIEAREEAADQVAYILRVNDDLDGFYALCRQRGEPWVRATAGLGRLLRSPTLFEDAVKVICTTNIQWGGTRRMVNQLVDVYGEPWPGDPTLKAFPTPEAIAAATPEEFAERVRLGYRTPHVHALACRVAAGQLDLEALTDTKLPTPELRKRLLAINGVGPYAAASLLMLLGRYDDLSVDTEFRQFVSRRYFGGEKVSDAQMRAVYEDWGEFKYLGYWFELWTHYQERGQGG